MTSVDIIAPFSLLDDNSSDYLWNYLLNNSPLYYDTIWYIYDIIYQYTIASIYYNAFLLSIIFTFNY